MSKGRTTEAPDSAPERMSFLVVPRFNMSTLITMIEVMRVANYLSPAPLYSWEIVSFDGADVPSSNGLSLAARPPDDRNRRGETVFVLASWNAEAYSNARTLNWLRRHARTGMRVCAVELGCYLVARAGLLSGNLATTHWSWMSGFQEQFDDVSVVEQLFTIDGQMMTCAGGLAGVDLVLKLVGDAHGERLAQEVADQMLYHPIRLAEAPQRRPIGRGQETLSPIVRDAIALIEQHIAEPMPVPEVADRLGVSQRQLERQFKARVGCTVVQFGLLLRLQHARVLLIATELSVREIATASGFNTLSHFAYSFGRRFGRRPSDYRQAWPEKDAAPSWPGTLAKFLEALENQGTAKPFQVLRKSGA
ncbi:HTH-type transcriptional regulator CdhR [Defluviimonas aquaemixtae]|uniref:HTH-type transcriptional regulator CdhR n=1 Tax=Albidovulum aquaemixtae TaxID=1542388 RepID=A0A2R8BLD6_9RHOB|nr:GlxA family transcriptional regulator [Defluviimonas aquaemixtae]SPH24241.1 HTH-type transcriptional regulator CdhR [Defluviimonas aquaemixtae]